MKRATAALSIVLLSLSTVAGASDIRRETIHFKPGTTSTNIEAKIKGRETVDYIVNAKAGQMMNISMANNNGANYFNIIAPGKEDAALFIGSTSENQFEGFAPKSGDYTIRVYLMRSAARRNETGAYRLEIIIHDFK